MHLPPHVIEAFATAPGRILTTGDLRELGHHRLESAAWCREGLTERLLHGLYREEGAAVPADQCLHVPVRYLEQRRPADLDPAVLTGEAVLAHHDVPGFELPCTPTLLVDERRRPRSKPGAFTAVRGTLPPDQVDLHRGLREAVIARAVADAVAYEGTADGRVITAVDELRNRRLLDLPDGVRTWRATANAGSRHLLDLWAAGAFDQESPGERELFDRVFRRFPPEPDCQVVVVGRFRVDFVFLSAGLVIEYLGRPHDGRADTDATRDHAIELIGYRIIRVTRSMLRDPAGLARFIHGVRRQREQLIADGVLPLPPLPRQPERRLPLRTLALLG